MRKAKLKIEVSYDPAIPLLGIYHEEIMQCTPLFIAALFTIARNWKQPKCLSTDELFTLFNKMMSLQLQSFHYTLNHSHHLKQQAHGNYLIDRIIKNITQMNILVKLENGQRLISVQQHIFHQSFFLSKKLSPTTSSEECISIRLCLNFHLTKNYWKDMLYYQPYTSFYCDCFYSQHK